jgi:hypothetical protein
MTTMPRGGYEEPPDGGEVRVAEQGFTAGESPAVNAADHDAAGVHDQRARRHLRQQRLGRPRDLLQRGR